MAQLYDISAKITNELPTLKVTEDIICTVNNRKSNVLNVQVMLAERERKQDEQEDNPVQEFENMQAALKLLIGEKNATAIDELDLPVNEYTELFRAIMAAAQGVNPLEANPNTP